jgi:hypothetical protein
MYCAIIFDKELKANKQKRPIFYKKVGVFNIASDVICHDYLKSEF